MSSVTNIYDALTSFIETNLPNHKQLNNPYDISNDAELTYDAAYGVAILGGSDTEGNINSSTFTRQRDFQITLTKRKFATSRDKAARAVVEKELMADWELLINAIASDKHLGNKTLVTNAKYISDSGIEFLTLDKARNNVMVVNSIIQIDYHESVSLVGC